jgi:hypothetical protein
MSKFLPISAAVKYSLSLYNVRVDVDERQKFYSIIKEFYPLRGRRIAGIRDVYSSSTYEVLLTEEESNFLKLSLSANSIISKNPGSIIVDELYG